MISEKSVLEIKNYAFIIKIFGNENKSKTVVITTRMYVIKEIET